MDFITYKTSSPSGDLISFLSGMKQVYTDTGRKAVVYQRIDMVGSGYEGSVHPYENDLKEPVCMNEKTFQMMRPLLLEQEYIEDYILFDGQQAEIDLDRIRLQTFTNQPLGSLNRWPAYCFPDMATDLSKRWINVYAKGYARTNKKVEESIGGKAIVNFTERYRNHFIHYFFLSEFQNDLIFAGLPHEHERFCKTWKLDIPLLIVTDFKELARVINSCKFFMGNQSMCFQIAEALKTPRILETFHIAPNVIPVGEHAYDFYHQGAVEYYFHKLMNQ